MHVLTIFDLDQGLYYTWENDPRDETGRRIRCSLQKISDPSSGAQNGRKTNLLSIKCSI